MSEGLECIGAKWFENTTVREIIIPKSVKKIGENAFYGCKNLISIILQEGLESIGDNWFKNASIKEIVIPKSVKTIGDKAFEYCSDLTRVIL